MSKLAALLKATVYPSDISGGCNNDLLKTNGSLLRCYAHVRGVGSKRFLFLNFPFLPVSVVEMPALV
ncbi:hypothetical protein [Runella aurantiaca]|uniref:hypothetical protein n=1 Tax=Runella aurantiaca TaxID=2282308 RepID=UPI0011C032C5|nr:hypothetical protein [Runella aurantiaca]